MNRKETKEAIKVMQAFVDGEEIETRSKRFTSDSFEKAIPSWNFEACVYRVKPKPREFWLLRDSRCLSVKQVYTKEIDAKEMLDSIGSGEVIHVREVKE